MGVTVCSMVSNTNHFSTESIRALRDIMYVKKYQKGSYVFWEGDFNSQLYFLLDGKVNLTKLNKFGKNLTLTVYFPEDLFGEYDLSLSQKNSYSALAIESSQIGIIKHKDLQAKLMDNGNLAAEFFQWQSLQRQYVYLKLRDLLLYGKNGALASTLIRAANTYGYEKDGKIILSEKLTNNDLAQLIGATRETVNRLLAALKKDGLITIENRKIEILNLTGLKQINHCERCPIEICRL